MRYTCMTVYKLSDDVYLKPVSHSVIHVCSSLNVGLHNELNCVLYHIC